MPGTRSSARLSSSQNESSTPAAKSSSNGTKRKADSSPSTTNVKKGRKTEEKEQKTIEETMAGANEDAEEDQPKDIEMKEAGSSGEGQGAEPDKVAEAKTTGDGEKVNGAPKEGHDDETIDDDKTIKPGDSFQGKNKEGETKDDPEKALKDSRGGPGLNVLGGDGDKSAKPDALQDDVHADPKEDSAPAINGGAVEESKERADAMPSNIMEKGIIHFFTRGRVSVDDPDSVADLQRSYFVLRPLPSGAKLTDGAIEDLGNNRLLALPKKVWPKSSRDKFMAFVEKGKATMSDLKENFFQGSEYSTQTVGTRQTPAVTPVAEGVYAITKAGDRDETHLAYMITIPREPGEMQEDMGIRPKGSFILSLKNPTVKGPAYASLPEKPDFPKEFIEEFHGRSWMSVQPKHLDYPNTQILMIGEDFDESHALDATSKDQKSGQKETPIEELEKLEGEDEIRVEHLKGDDTVFADLGISHKEYPSVPTTW